MLKTIRAAGFAVLLFSCSAESFAQRWDYLGEANVDRSVDHDKIIVTGVRGEFRSIQIRVEKAPVQFDRVVIHYGDRDSEPISIRNRIPVGGQTRVIDLPGNSHAIRSVEFWYARPGASSPKPKVRLFGMH
jgi:hypothetical protein